MSMKKILLGSIASVFVFTACVSNANAGVKEQPCGIKPYMAVRAGYSMLDNHIDKNTWDASLAVGTKMDAFRVEGEYTYRGEIKGRYKGERHKLGAQSLLINGYYDIDMDSAFTPFINASLGMSRLHEKKGHKSDNLYRAVWGGGAGVAYNMTQDISFDLGYRFLDLGDKVKSNEFYGGVRFAF